MHLGQAIGFHSGVILSGWNQQATMWEEEISRGDFRRQDQFVVNRSFGLVKRLFNTPAGCRIPSRFRCVRTVEDDIYIIESENVNLRGDRAYSYAYQLRRAPFWAEVHKASVETLASGMPGRTGSRPLYRCPADIERYGVLGSDEMEGLRYSQISVILPGNVAIDVDNKIVIDGVVFEISEAYTQVLETVAICVKLEAPS